MDKSVPGGLLPQKPTMKVRLLTLLLIPAAVMLALAAPGWALQPHEVLVIANGNVDEGVDLSKYYMRMRDIPEDQLIVLTVPDRERISGREYETSIAMPVRNHLRKKGRLTFIRCLVLMYGMPLRVVRANIPDKANKLKGLKVRRQNLETDMAEVKGDAERREIKAELNKTEKEIFKLEKTNRNASVDSEIALVLAESYDLLGWIENPLFWGNRGKPVQHIDGDPLMVSRLDGPSKKMVRKMITDTLSAEAKGLQGNAYFDARWPKPDKQKASGYAFYDQSIHLAAKRLRKKGTMPVVLNEEEALFQPGDCPQAAVYCGWYSLRKYVDAFDWLPGAVGYHVASFECATLKRQDSRVWCKRMIEEGVAATLGPVEEPYVEAFPPPEIFFGFLLDGRFSLAKCFAASNPFLSWKMVLIGDPLYRPFKKVRTETLR